MDKRKFLLWFYKFIGDFFLSLVFLTQKWKVLNFFSIQTKNNNLYKSKKSFLENFREARIEGSIKYFYEIYFFLIPVIKYKILNKIF